MGGKRLRPAKRKLREGRYECHLWVQKFPIVVHFFAMWKKIMSYVMMAWINIHSICTYACAFAILDMSSSFLHYMSYAYQYQSKNNNCPVIFSTCRHNILSMNIVHTNKVRIWYRFVYMHINATCSCCLPSYIQCFFLRDFLQSKNVLWPNSDECKDTP